VALAETELKPGVINRNRDAFATLMVGISAWERGAYQMKVQRDQQVQHATGAHCFCCAVRSWNICLTDLGGWFIGIFENLAEEAGFDDDTALLRKSLRIQCFA